jgi:hypothetical protein
MGVGNKFAYGNVSAGLIRKIVAQLGLPLPLVVVSAPIVSAGHAIVTLRPGAELPKNGAVFVRSRTMLTHDDSSGVVDTAAVLPADVAISVKDGVTAILTPLTGGTNPQNSTGFAVFEANGSDAGFVGAGPPTAIFTIVGGNLVLTITNPGATTAQNVQTNFDFDELSK